jgi:hypothetical protein
MMIVVMKVMNLRIFAAIVIVQLVGDAAPPTIITDVYLNGCSAPAKMTVGTAQTNSKKTATNARKRASSGAATNDAFLSGGSVILKTIVAITLTRMRRCATVTGVSVQNLNFHVRTKNVFPPGGSVMEKMIVEMPLLKRSATFLNAQRIDSNVPLAIVLRMSLCVMVKRIVLTYLTKLIVSQDILMVDSVHWRNLSAPTICALVSLTCAIIVMIARMVQMKLRKFVPTLTAHRRINSNVVMANVSLTMSSATELQTVLMLVMKII